MKNTNKILACTAALLTASLLAACGSTPADSAASTADTTPTESAAADTAEEEAADNAESTAPVSFTGPTLQDIRDANNAAALINTYGKVGLKETSYDADGNVTFTVNTSAEQSDGSSSVVSITTMQTEDGSTSTYLSTLAQNDTVCAALYLYQNPDDASDEKTVTFMPQSDFDASAAPYISFPKNEIEAQSSEASMQDDVLVLETTTDVRTQGGGVYTTVYYADPDTLIVKSVVSSYVDENGDSTGYELYEYTYGDDVQLVTADRDLVSEALPADTSLTCDLTIYFNYGQDDEEVQEYHVAKDFSVYATSTESPYMYSDPELQNMAYEINVTGDTATVYLSAKL